MLLLSVLCLPLWVPAQTPDSCDNTHLIFVDPSKPAPAPWTADSVWLGATFLRDSTKPLIVWFRNMEADWGGSELYVVVPGASADGSDSLLFLFTNTAGARVDITDDPIVKANIHHGDTIVFWFTTGKGNHQGYSGPNRRVEDGPPTNPCLREDVYTHDNYNPATIVDVHNNLVEIGRRTCAAGWLLDSERARTDTVEFGFDDEKGGGTIRYDYNEILFGVSGVFLIRAAELNRIELSWTGGDTITAGQSYPCTATVWVDSADTVMMDLARSNEVQWYIDPADEAIGAALTCPDACRANSFSAIVAYRWYTIKASYIDTATGDAVSVVDSVYVMPGAPHRLYLEGDSVPPLNSTSSSVDTVNLSSAVLKDSVYAVLRDQYDNYVRSSNPTSWQVVSGAAYADVTPGRAGLGEGEISQVGPPGTAVIKAADTDSAANTRFHDTVTVVVDSISYDALRLVVGQGGQKRVIDSLVIDRGYDTVLYAEAHRADGLGGDNGWMPLRVKWSTNNLTYDPTSPPPSSATEWTFRPVDDTGKGTIAISYADLSYTLYVQVRSPSPASVDIYDQTGDPAVLTPLVGPLVKSAGTPVPLVAKVFDLYGRWLPEYEDTVLSAQYLTWEARLSADPNAPVIDTSIGAFSTDQGHETVFTPKRARTTVYISVVYQKGGLLLRDTLRIKITPGAIDHMVIEASDDSTQSPYADNPLDKIELHPADTQATAYAVFRDRYGNFVRFADSAAWLSRNSSLVTAQIGPKYLAGEGVITRADTTESSTQVVASLAGFSDSVKVFVSRVTYDAIQIYVLNPGVELISSLSVRTDQDTTLYVRGRRSDNGQWVDVTGTWTSPGLTMTPAAPHQGVWWTFSPNATGGGHVVASMNGSSGSIRDSVAVTVNAGLPDKLELYPAEGEPGVDGNAPYPPQTTTDTVTAGRARTLVAKLFDHNDVWLSQYENAATLIRWTVSELSENTDVPTGSLEPRQGHKAVFTPTRAYNTVDITATYEIGNRQLVDIVRLYVKPDTAAQLFIEPSSLRANSPHAGDPLSTISFTPRDTTKYAYAVLRDRLGNFVSASPATDWTSLATTIVGASEGVAANGEGVIERKAKEGTADVIARNRTRQWLFDTVEVVLSPVAYDSLRIVTGDATPVAQLTMRTDEQTTLMVQGKRSDNGMWEYVPADWALTGGLTTTPAPPLSSNIWTFSPNDTGSALIVVTKGTSVPDTVSVHFTPGLPDGLVLYPGGGMPGGANLPYPDPVQQVDAVAGVSDTIFAKVFDHNGVWLDTILTGVTWRLQELTGSPPTGTIDTSGIMALFNPVRASNTVYVIAEMQYESKRMRDTVQFFVNPGPAHHLVLEANQSRSVSPHADNPIDTLVITKRSTYARVYAIVRDTFQNWVGYSELNVWGSEDTSVVSVDDGNSVIGEGIVTRTASQDSADTVQIWTASESYPGLTDSTYVAVVNISYDSLRIVVAAGTRVDSLWMSTNDDTTLYVEGLRSDNGQWERVKVTWHASDSLNTSPAAPELANQWSFSPTTPLEEGQIWVTMPEDTVATPDTIGVHFERGEPLDMEFELLTRPEDRIAGDTITAVVRIRNRDGYVPGSYCYAIGGDGKPAHYWDPLGPGSRDRPQPVVIGGQDTSTIDASLVDTSRLEQCFEDGVDTVQFVLYYAPYNLDSVHEMRVELGTLSGSSDPFRLLPGPLDTLVLQDHNGDALADTLTLQYPDGAVLIMAMGYDSYGNKVGRVSSSWRTTETLHPPQKTDQVSQVYYTSGSITDNEQGWLKACASDTLLSSLCDSVRMYITGYLTELTSATTRDISGNGYLDRIDLKFAKNVELIDSVSVEDILVHYGTDTIAVDSVGVSATDSSLVYVYLREDTTSNEPQTAWKPSISIGAIKDVVAIADEECADGAGPVVWSVVKTMGSATEREKDRIVVTFSEPILGDGAQVDLDTPPESLFVVWRLNEQGELDTAVGMLSGITHLQTAKSTRVEFLMENGKDLMTRHFININVEPGIITDAQAGLNEPAADNRRVRIELITKPPDIAPSFPNPTRATFRREAPGVLNLQHQPLARHWARDDRAGSVITISVTRPAEGTIRAYLKIYDMVGNLVHSVINTDLLDGLPPYTSVYDIDVYWNGSNEKGMIVAPGVYRFVIYLDYDKDNLKDTKLFGNIGIGK